MRWSPYLARQEDRANLAVPILGQFGGHDGEQGADLRVVQQFFFLQRAREEQEASQGGLAGGTFLACNPADARSRHARRLSVQDTRPSCYA